jgi:predicted metal-dependent phosphoesterase TrpH
MDWFTLTDHDTMSGWEALVRELPEADRALVIPGVEHTLHDPSLGFTLHVNLFGLDPDAYADLQRRAGTLDELIAYCEAAGIRYQYNHPTWWERKELKRGEVDFAKVPEIASRFGVLELNAARTPEQNLITVSMAEEMGLALTASSDSHTGEVGRAYTEAAAATADEFLDAVWRGEGVTHLEPLSYSGLLREAHTLIDELVDNGSRLVMTRKASTPAQIWLESLATRIVRSRAIQENAAVRESLRRLLKQVTRPIMKTIMGMESRLDGRLAASSLRPYTSLRNAKAA